MPVFLFEPDIKLTTKNTYANTPRALSFAQCFSRTGGAHAIQFKRRTAACEYTSEEELLGPILL